MLLNQAVLLRGINDTVDQQAELSRALVSAGVVPYYLHSLDPVAGAHHFDVPEDEGRSLIKQLHQQVSGYMIPEFVRELEGKAGKTPQMWNMVENE